MKFFKKFLQHSDYAAYINGSDKVLPNISYCENENEVHYNPWVETRVVATFNVTSTSSATTICNSSATSYFSEIEIDGVVQPSVVSSYTFDTTGEHTIKYTLVDPTILGENAFYECTGLTSITTPNSVTSIGSMAFCQCTGLTSITIPNSVTSIGDYTFSNCSGLTSITIGNSVTSIGEGAFYYCESLTSMTIPNSVTSIGSMAFGNCTGLTSITIGNSVTSIGMSAFTYCSGLTNVVIPNSVTTIDYCAFESCLNLTSVTIPNSVTFIGDGAFGDCSSLTSVTLEATTPPTLGSDAFYYNASGRKIYVPSESVNTYKAASGWSTYANDIEAIA